MFPVVPGNHVVTVGDTSAIVVGGLGKAALDPTDQVKGYFRVELKSIYYFRSQGFGVKFLSRNEAMKELPALTSLSNIPDFPQKRGWGIATACIVTLHGDVTCRAE